MFTLEILEIAAPKIFIRKAKPMDDVLIQHFIALHMKQHEYDDKILTQRNFLSQLRDHKLNLHSFIIHTEQENIGHALCLFLFSSFSSNKILYIEDIYIREDFRGLGIGKGVMDFLSKFASLHGCCGLEWKVHKDNHLARHFYFSIGAQPEQTWDTYGLTITH